MQYLVHQAFDQMDRQGTDTVAPQELISKYDSARHPDVLSNTRSADDVMSEFLHTVDVGGVVPGKITRQEFLQYYSNIAPIVNDEERMAAILKQCWHVREGNANFGQPINANSNSNKNNSIASRIRDAQTFNGAANNNQLDSLLPMKNKTVPEFPRPNSAGGNIYLK